LVANSAPHSSLAILFSYATNANGITVPLTTPTTVENENKVKMKIP